MIYIKIIYSLVLTGLFLAALSSIPPTQTVKPALSGYVQTGDFDK